MSGFDNDETTEMGPKAIVGLVIAALVVTVLVAVAVDFNDRLPGPIRTPVPSAGITGTWETR